jgi:hypothetical protein
MLQARRSWVRFLKRSSDFSIDLILPALGSTQPLTEMSTRNLAGGERRPERKADNLAAVCEPTLDNVGASTSHKPMSLHGLLQGELYLFLTLK